MPSQPVLGRVGWALVEASVFLGAFSSGYGDFRPVGGMGVPKVQSVPAARATGMLSCHLTQTPHGHLPIHYSPQWIPFSKVLLMHKCCSECFMGQGTLFSEPTRAHSSHCQLNSQELWCWTKRSWPLVGKPQPIFQMGTTRAPRGLETHLSHNQEKSPNSKLHQEIIITDSVTQLLITYCIPGQ